MTKEELFEVVEYRLMKRLAGAGGFTIPELAQELVDALIKRFPEIVG